MIEAKHATESDLDWLLQEDEVTQAWAERCIKYNEYIVAFKNGTPIGFLRYSLFWSSIPYMDMIRVLPKYQKQGVGSTLFDFWQQKMRQKNHKLLMTSSESDEPDPQAWHIRNGFTKSGELTFGQLQIASETFFVKELAE